MEAAPRIGRWWFQRRSASPLPWIVLLVLLPPERHFDGPTMALIVVGLFLSEALRLLSVAYAGSATRTRGDTVPQLVHAGPYRYVRNPLYIANIAMYTLCGFLFGFVALSVGIFVYSCIQYTFIVAFEEETLARTFGASYDEYRRRVPRWIPSFTPQVPSTPHTFDLAASFRSERSTLVAMAAVFVMFFVKRFAR